MLKNLLLRKTWRLTQDKHIVSKLWLSSGQGRTGRGRGRGVAPGVSANKIRWTGGPKRRYYFIKTLTGVLEFTVGLPPLFLQNKGQGVEKGLEMVRLIVGT